MELFQIFCRPFCPGTFLRGFQHTSIFFKLLVYPDEVVKLEFWTFSSILGLIMEEEFESHFGGRIVSPNSFHDELPYFFVELSQFFLGSGSCAWKNYENQWNSVYKEEKGVLWIPSFSIAWWSRQIIGG